MIAMFAAIFAVSPQWHLVHAICRLTAMVPPSLGVAFAKRVGLEVSKHPCRACEGGRSPPRALPLLGNPRSRRVHAADLPLLFRPVFGQLSLGLRGGGEGLTRQLSRLPKCLVCRGLIEHP